MRMTRTSLYCHRRALVSLGARYSFSAYSGLYTNRPFRVDVMTRCGNQTSSKHSAYCVGTRAATAMHTQLVALHCAYLALITKFADI